MTPQAFSYATVSKNGNIYVPPYGLTESIDYLLKIDPVTFEIKKIKVATTGKTERWTYGVEVNGWIYFFPYNESIILALNTKTDSVEHIYLQWPDNTANIKGKYISFHVHNNKIVALPYGEYDEFNHALVFDTAFRTSKFVEIDCKINDLKKWHTSQLIGDTIHAVPRGERWDKNYFPYAIEFNCNTLEYTLDDLSKFWQDCDQELYSNKKYTTLAQVNGKLYAAPYSENPNFDILLTYNNGWQAQHTGITATSRTYFTHKTATNGKIYFPPAGHEETWSEMLVIDSADDSWKIIDLGIGKESKKYFAGCENSQGKIYWIPRGGCVCEPEDTWKSQGDLAEVLVVDTATDEFYTIDVSQHFVDNTTIEKYNCCVIINDIIFAFPYGESDSFQTMLIFDTVQERVIKVIDLNEI